MRRISYFFLLIISFVFGSSAFAQKNFVREDLASPVIRLEARLKKASESQVKPAAVLRQEAEALALRDKRRAVTAMEIAVGADTASSSGWLSLSRMALAADARDSGDGYRLRELATAAAYNAYLKANARSEEGAALAMLAQAFSAGSQWRPALDTYRSALERADNAGVREKYQALREERGFRLADGDAYKVDSDSASPRVCFQFTESLQRGKIDFTPYIAVSGASNPAVTAEDRQLCVDGLKHGERYTIMVRQGLPSSVGEALLKTADFTIYVRDRSAQARFAGRNYVLPRLGQEGIPVVSVNTAKVKIAIARIGDRSLLPTVRSEAFLNQLNAYQANRYAKEQGINVWSGTLETKGELNRDVTTAFPVLEAVGKLEPGVYVMTAWPDKAEPQADSSSDEEDYSERSTQWFVVSDLGLTAMNASDGVHVFLRSLASAKPISGVELRLIAKNNEVLGVLTSDANGHARFDPGLSRGAGGLEPGMVVASDKTGDYGFLDLQQSAFDLSDRGVKGRAAPKGLDAFVFAERGVYRSGEDVNLTTMLRDSAGNAVSAVPLTLVIKRPDGVEYKRVRVEDQGLGGRAFVLPLLSGAPHGTWRVQAYADPKGSAIGETSFLLEDYVPERLAVELTPKEKMLRQGQPAEIEVKADFLYGAAGAGLDVSGEVAVKLADEAGIPGIKGYAIGLSDEPFEAVTSEIEEKAKTDAKGRAVISAPIPEAIAPRPLEAKITLRVGEAGGRAVERSVTMPILPTGAVLAVKKLFSDENLSEGANAGFDVIAVNPDGGRIARNGVTWELSRIDRRYQWFNQDGRWSFDAVKSTRRVADGKVDVVADSATRISAPVSYGQYRLDIRADGSSLQPVSITFNVGWSGEATASTPDLLETIIDKQRYKPGESVQVKLTPRFEGVATLAVVADAVREIVVVPVPKEGAVVSLPVKAEWGAGAYVVALAHRPLDQAAKRMPGRSLGVAWLGIDAPGRSLQVSVNTPEKLRPRGKLTIPVHVAGTVAGEEAFVTVAAVDLGILTLTRYETPDPTKYFFGQKQLSAAIRDLYGFLIDGMQGTRGAIRSGGDAGAAKLDGAPPTQQPFSFYSGVVKLGADGKAEVTFDMPAFNGTARVMVAAWSKSGVGQAQKDVVVRDPVVVAGTLPRFMNFGDDSRFFMQIDNVEGPAGDYLMELDVQGPVSVTADAARRVLKMTQGGKSSLTIPVKAAGLGTATIDLRLSGNGLDLTQSFRLTVLPGTSEVFHRTVRALPSAQSVTLSHDALDEFLPGTGMLSVAIAPFGGLDVPGLLGALDRYPYGCSEQIVSRAMPLLYVNKLAKTEALALDPNLDERIREAIERVLARQDSNGSFGLWSVGGTDDYWLDSFIADFLTRARERNFAVPQKAFDITLDRLRNYVANVSDVKAGGEDLAYAIYVLARNGRPVMSDLRYLADTKLDSFKTPLARAQIAAALALLGDRARAQTLFNAASETLSAAKPDRVSRADYGSRLRDGAGIMALAAEVNLAKDVVQKAATIVSDARGSTRYTSTQENAWMILAAQALVADAQGVSLSVNGEKHQGPLYRSFRSTTLARAPMEITNTGNSSVQVVMSTSGHPLTQEPPLAQGYKLERDYYRLNGTKVDLSKVTQNDRLVVVLKVTESEALFARLLLVDKLPAGFEIDNPSLVAGGSLEGFSWLKQDIEPANTEYRDDRFVAAFNRTGDKSAEFSVAYMVRAVAPGTYVHPAASIEDMYRPERFGRTGYGRVDVAPARP